MSTISTMYCTFPTLQVQQKMVKQFQQEEQKLFEMREQWRELQKSNAPQQELEALRTRGLAQRQLVEDLQIKFFAPKFLEHSPREEQSKKVERSALSALSLLDGTLPEECIAEIRVLHERLIATHHTFLGTHFILLRAVLESFWAFYIQVKVENLWLPKKGSKKTIDE
ncbi:hypothetical protein H6F86_10595 [Phormidium sp. FACHB-592]|uniref:Uncharacterized protein n=1 Tax=Stenomitos frigidus AS-A4 TaxID=2933935 RepID=A0ABV0KRY7_9CYAN|nr:hypothetical protein [Phormidium sp. FACHB-592]MBD2074325.1 hypothetical protein [Phormidium sp. FACHB-592]